MTISVLLLGVTLGAGGAPVAVITAVAGSGASEVVLCSGKALEFPIKQPFGVEFGPDGALFICEIGHHRVLRLDRKAGVVSTVAGNGKKGSSGDGGPATEASLEEPYEVRFDARGTMYFVEMVGARVRRVDRKTGVITTVAGTGEQGFSGDGGPAVKARLRSPHSIALDSRGSLYIADIGNHRIRRVDLQSGVIETIAGNGERKLPKEGAVATGRPILGPRALCISGRTLWIALREGHSVWKMDLDTRKLAHVAGTGKKGFRDGSAEEAMFNGPKGIVAGPGPTLHVVDTENQAIRRIDLRTRQVSTLAGVGPAASVYGGDGGPARRATLGRPHGITVDGEGAIYIGDTDNHRVRRIK